MIKRVLVLFCFAALLASPAVSYAQSNLLTNPGFESNFTSWNSTGWALDAEEHHTGANSARGTSGVTISQLVEITEAGSYTFSAHVLGSGASGWIDIYINEESFVQLNWTGGVSWVQADTTTSIAADATVEVRAHCSVGDCYYDDLAFTRVNLSPTAVPTQIVVDGIWYQYLYVDRNVEVTDPGETFCPRERGENDKLIVHAFGAYEPVNDTGCMQCMHGFCTAGDFLYELNPDPQPFNRLAGGMAAMTQPAAMYDAFPVLSFTRSFAAIRATISQFTTSNLVRNGLITFVAIVVTYMIAKGLISIFAPMPSYAPGGSDYGSSIDEVTVHSRSRKSGRGLRSKAEYDGQE